MLWSHFRSIGTIYSSVVLHVGGRYVWSFIFGSGDFRCLHVLCGVDAIRCCLFAWSKFPCVLVGLMVLLPGLRFN